MAKAQPFEITDLAIDSPDHALLLLFEANRDLQAADRALASAKNTQKEMQEHRDALLEYIDLYSSKRREHVARQELLADGFSREPMPPWSKPGADPDKPDLGL